MQYIADLHIHSPYSRATSKLSNLAGLAAWARIKGIQVLGTGDFTHPGWFRQIKELLMPAEPGFFKLKEESKQAVSAVLASVEPSHAGLTAEAVACRFILTAEISSIYKRHGKVRKIHNILFVPDFKSAEQINRRLASIGNIESDGRPILGLDSRNLLEILLENAPDGFLVPAHIWTPWFSLFGSKSGFDAIEECFDDLSEHIFALETGLSSDPDMNRMVSALDRFALISNSDCHSPSKLGREANLFDTDFHFHAMRDALQHPFSGKFQGTIEFYPEEGKYHLDGHRKCKICFEPEETLAKKGVCPVCGRALTVGVSHRVRALSDRREPFYPDHSPTFKSLIPLSEVLGEILHRGPATKGVMTQYNRLISLFGSEFNILLNTPIEELNQRYSPILGEAVNRIRTGKVIRKAGYDGEFGVITVFNQGELTEMAGQGRLFEGMRTRKAKVKKKSIKINDQSGNDTITSPKKTSEALPGLNHEQITAVESDGRHQIVTAGPGTGKTFTLIARIKHLLENKQVDPAVITAITFTNKAAEEVKTRLRQDTNTTADLVFINTFHGFCLYWLRKDTPTLTVVGDEARQLVLKAMFPDLTFAENKEFRSEITGYLQEVATKPKIEINSPPEINGIRSYLGELKRQNSIDLDGVVPFFVQRLFSDSAFRKSVSDSVAYLFIDEFQDLNHVQYKLVTALAETAQVFAIGDPDQAIYGFRGSKPDFFFRFIREFDPDILTLTRNYRSAPAFLTAAGEVISHNYLPNRKSLIPKSTQSTELEQFFAVTPKEEAQFVVRRIEEIMGGISHFSINSGRGGDIDDILPRSFSDIAVLYRLSQQALELSQALEKRGIPFQVVDVPPFYMQSLLRPIYYWIRVAAGHGDNADHLALLKYVKGIGDNTIRKLEKELALSDKDFFMGIKEMDLSRKSKGILGELHVFIGLFEDKVRKAGLVKALQEALEWLQIDGTATDTDRFLDLAGTFGSDLAGFSTYLKKNSRATVYDENAESVSLMTLHAAKGLEFPVVFITGVEENLLPCNIFNKNQDDMTEKEHTEEERRLFYVGLTRARESLILSSSATRTLFGKNHQQQVSPFLSEISSHLITRSKRTAKKKKKPTAVQMSLFE